MVHTNSPTESMECAFRMEKCLGLSGLFTTPPPPPVVVVVVGLEEEEV